MQISDMEFFHEAAKRICGSLDAKTMLEDALDYLRKFMPADGLNLNTYDPEKKMIFSIADVNLLNEKWLNHPAELSDEGIKLIQTDHFNKVQIFNPLEKNPVAESTVNKTFYSKISVLVMHLKVSKERLGVLAVSAKGRDLYTQEHARLLALLHDPFAIAMANTLQHQEVLRLKNILTDDFRYLAGELRQISGDEIVGAEYGLKPVMDMVRQAAPLDSHVLLLGETGTGKEVIANAIHHSSRRHNGPFIKVNCGALPENLVDSELFGHEKGSFTGAIGTRRGRFERAHGGSIFLDEIGDLPLTAQTKLLRVIQEKQIERVGGSRPIDLDIRIIAATHQDLQQMVREQTFREDLWFRLNVFPITIPPLRQRKSDIPELVNYFVRRKCHEMKIRLRPRITPDQIEKLMGYHWPGNVRELENLVEKALIRASAGAQGESLMFDDVKPPAGRGASRSIPCEPGSLNLDDMIREHIQKALVMCNGKVEGPDGAARQLGVNPSTLRNRMRKLGVSFGKNKNK